MDWWLLLNNSCGCFSYPLKNLTWGCSHSLSWKLETTLAFSSPVGTFPWWQVPSRITSKCEECINGVLWPGNWNLEFLKVSPEFPHICVSSPLYSLFGPKSIFLLREFRATRVGLTLPSCSYSHTKNNFLNPFCCSDHFGEASARVALVFPALFLETHAALPCLFLGMHVPSGSYT